MSNKKLRFDLIPYSAMLEETKVLMNGCVKYSENDWREGKETWCQNLSSAMHHILRFIGGQDLDNESKLLHLAHARTRLGFAIEYYIKGIGTDDRYKKENKPQRVVEIPRLSQDVRSTLQPTTEACLRQFEFNLRDCDGRSAECDAPKDKGPA